MARPKGLNPCSIALAVETTNTNPRGPTNHAHTLNSNLRFDPCFPAFQVRLPGCGASRRLFWPVRSIETARVKQPPVVLAESMHGSGLVRRLPVVGGVAFLANGEVVAMPLKALVVNPLNVLAELNE